MIYTQSDIQINSSFDFVFVQNITLELQANEHPSLSIEAIIREDDVQKIVQKIGPDQEITWSKTDGSILFVGFPFTFTIERQGGVLTLFLLCKGKSFLLDIKKQKRSFQYRKDTYADILKFVYTNDKNSAILPIRGNNVQIERPIFQYNETDWNFTKRMAGHLNTLILSDERSSHSRVYYGLPTRKSYSVKDSEYTMGMNKKGEKFIQIHTKECYTLGDTIVFGESTLPVVRAVIQYKNNYFYNKYEIGTEKGNAIKKYDLPLTGLTLRGRVLETSGELLRVHLDIDPVQEIDRAFWFEFVPQSGNVMYSMPQIGTFIMLKFSKNQDYTPLAIECYRTNGQECGELYDYNYRYYTTEFKKRMAMFPEKLFLTGGTNTTSLNDLEGIIIKTGKKLSISGAEGISVFSNKETLMHTPEHIYATKYNSESVIDMAASEIHIDSINSSINPTGNGKENTYPSIWQIPNFSISQEVAGSVLGMIPKNSGMGKD